MEAQQTGHGRDGNLEKFYTSDEVAASCVASLLELRPALRDYLWVEPAAGDGAFLRALPGDVTRIGLDIAPEGPGILEQDFFTWEPPTGNVVCFGNPPFGRQSSLVRRFYTKACMFSDYVAFLAPLSWSKETTNRAVPLNFHLILQTFPPKNSFLVNGLPHDVPSVFQVWEKRSCDRALEGEPAPVGFHMVQQGGDHNLRVRRVGGRAGKIDPEGRTRRSHMYIQLEEEFVEHMERVKTGMDAHKYPYTNVGPKSLSKREVILVLNLVLRKIKAEQNSG